MITSALISQCRRAYNDIPKSTQVSRASDGQTSLFNVGRYPVVEGSYTVRYDGTIKTETTQYTLDKDNGDLLAVGTPATGVNVQVNYKYANFRDQQWVEAINYGIESLNGRGFFRQIVRSPNTFRLSANVRLMSGPTDAVDVYEIFPFSNRTSATGDYASLPGNWDYQQDQNKINLHFLPQVAEPAAISYLRNLRTYNATSATLDVPQDWIELVKIRAGEYYFRHMASKIATQGNATIDEGHFSFTNARTMANDLDADFEKFALRKKPTRPAKDILYHIPGGGR